MMKKILVRMTQIPTEQLTLQNILSKNGLQNGFGELLTSYGLMQLLNQEEAVLTPFVIDHAFSDEEMSDINSSYDGVIIPMDCVTDQQGIRESYRMAEFIDKLTIPCAVMGLPLKKPFDCNKDRANVISIAAAACSKNHSVGSITKRNRYTLGKRKILLSTKIKPLGLLASYVQKPEKISCRKPDTKSKVAVSCSISDEPDLIKALFKALKAYDNYRFVAESRADYMLLYAGAQELFRGRGLPGDYPKNLLHAVVEEDREAACMCVTDWLKLIQTSDYYMGTDLRCVAAALSVGTPAVLLTEDRQKAALAGEYGIPCFLYEGGTIELKELFADWNADAYCTKWGRCVKKQKRFLRKTGIPVSKDHTVRTAAGEVNLVTPLFACGLEEQGERINLYSQYLKAQVAQDKKLMREYKKQKKG